MTRFILRLIPLAILALVVLYPSRAEARRKGFVFITHGKSIKHIGDVPEELKAEIRSTFETSEEPAVGFIYSQFGIFWLDIWTWGGEYCIYAGDEYGPIDEKDAAKLTGGDVGKPIFYRIPPGLSILVAIALLWVGVRWRSSVKTRAFADKMQGLLDDSRYKRAIEIFQEYYAAKAEKEEAEEQPADTPSGFPDVTHPTAEPPAVKEDDDAGFQKAVQHLVDHGIEREEAQENLGTLIAVLAGAEEGS